MVVFRDEPRPREQKRQELIVGWGVPASGRVPVPVGWQYRSLHTDGSVVTAVDGEETGLAKSRTPIASALEAMGTERWELVAIHDGADGPTYVFKRPTPGAA